MVSKAGSSKLCDTRGRVSVTLRSATNPLSGVLEWLKKRDRNLLSDPLIAFWSPLVVSESGASPLDVRFAAIKAIEKLEEQIRFIRQEMKERGIELPGNEPTLIGGDFSRNVPLTQPDVIDHLSAELQDTVHLPISQPAVLSSSVAPLLQEPTGGTPLRLTVSASIQMNSSTPEGVLVTVSGEVNPNPSLDSLMLSGYPNLINGKGNRNG